MTEWEHFDLNENILKNLENLDFHSPTEIQKKVLTYTNSKVDLIIQARTGEGKTLCYGIPIINYILNFYERAEDKIKQISPVALILVPTRELGLQVKNHLSAIIRDISESENEKAEHKIRKITRNSVDKEKEIEKSYFNIRIANVLGGFAKPKQIKILNKYNPEIIIATPGRLWEIIENEESPLLNNLSKLRFLVVDEADRMTEKGHFRELKKIIDFVYNKMDTHSAQISKNKKMAVENNNEDDECEEEFVEKHPEINLKSKIKNLKEFSGQEKTVEQQKEENKKIKKALKMKGVKIDLNKIEEIDPLEMFGDEGENMIDDFNFGEGIANEDDIYVEENEEENMLDNNQMKYLRKKDSKITSVIIPKTKIHLRTILCSATIENNYNKEDKNKKRSHSAPKNKRNEKAQEADNSKVNLDNLIKNLQFYNKLIYVKLSIDGDIIMNNENENKSNVLPEKLQLDCYKCESTIKDYYLFHILKENENKNIIVFTNSISHTKKLFSIFSFFDFKLCVLHSKMQQTQRVKNLDRFRNGKLNVLFCTDIGARGLDIPFVDLVIQYHIPKKTALFVHRAGRTARALQEGKCISLISEAEFNLYKSTMKDLKIKEFGMKTLNVNQLEKYKSLFEYAKKVEKEEHSIKKTHREKKWFETKSQECDIVFDDEDERDDNNRNVEEEEKFLTKKRKIFQKNAIKDKKVYHQIIASNIKRSSFLTPDMVQKLNTLMSDSKIKDLNLTKAIYDANTDAQAFRYKGKVQKKRYQRRRGGK